MDNFISYKMREDLFPNLSIPQIRDILKEKGLDPHTPIEAKSCGVIIYDRFGNILLHEKKAFPGVYGMIGGAQELNETPVEAVLRETKEEAGIYLNPEDLQLLKNVDTTTTYKNGDVVIYHMNIWMVRVKSFKISLSNFKEQETLSLVISNKDDLPTLHKNHEKYILEAIKAISV